MEVIKRWLDGNRSFVVGKLYYKQFGKDKTLQQLFDKSQTSFAQQKLVEALTALVNEEKKLSVPSNQTAHVAVMPKGSDDITIAIELEWRPLYQRMNYLRHELDKYDDDNSELAQQQCKILCDEILDLEQQCNVCWEKLDYYRLHHQLPEMKTNDFVIPTDPVELATLIQTLKRNIRRNKQKIKSRPGNATYAALVKKYEGQLKLLTDNK